MAAHLVVTAGQTARGNDTKVLLDGIDITNYLSSLEIRMDVHSANEVILTLAVTAPTLDIAIDSTITVLEYETAHPVRSRQPWWPKLAGALLVIMITVWIWSTVLMWLGRLTP